MLHTILGHGFTKKSGPVEVGDLSEFFELYSNPRDLEFMSTNLLKVIRYEYPQADHIGLLREFNQLVFGKRAEYYEQFKLLENGGVSSGRLEKVNTPEQEPHVARESASEGESFDVFSESDSEKSDKHPENEDSMLEMNTSNVRAFGVFDGVGGSKAGSKASRMVKNHLERELQNIPQHYTYSEVEDYLRKSLLDANEAILEQAKLDETDMASTAVVCVLWKNPENNTQKLIVAHVGDSRAYLLRKGELMSLTVDHSQLNSFFTNPEDKKKFQNITSNYGDVEKIIEEAKKQLHIDTKTEDSIRLLYKIEEDQIIRQALGRENTEPEIHSYDIDATDELFLCSDGVSDNIYENKLAEFLRENSSVSDIKNFAKNANRKPDDISLMRVKMSR